MGVGEDTNMENKKQVIFRRFLRWSFGVIIGEIYIRILVYLGTAMVIVWSIYKPGLSRWLVTMNIPTLLAISVMFFGAFVLATIAIASAISLVRYLLQKRILSNKKTNKESNVDTFKIPCKIRKDGNEIYIDVKNKEWFIDIIRVLFRCDFVYNFHAIRDPIEWIEGSNKKGETGILRCKTKTLHFATVRPMERTYNIHLLERELPFPFQNDRTIPLVIEGFTSAPITKPAKRNINGMILILESISKGEINFEIGVQH